MQWLIPVPRADYCDLVLLWHFRINKNIWSIFYGHILEHFQ